ncbi:uncharacterized protein LOC120766935 [Bactrocera tryoni]|uniref:uncharacterized protein LOC120766935 n=1 Tax=Bactrocera tryoni TaxID=59916 RepID=UPI001A971969|nr:uncharacterized protein LOC120766935 [Bactrocera tryoni]
MAEDILHQIRVTTANPDLAIYTEIHNKVLITLEDLCVMISGKMLHELGMPAPNRPMHDAFNGEFERERQYDTNDLSQSIQNKISLLNLQQKTAYDTIMKSVNDGNGEFFFPDAPDGTGKTFLISLIFDTIWAQSQIVLAVASSGIAATLLEGGRTAHSELKLPLNLQTIDQPTCNITKTSAMAKVLQNSRLIIWDECV